MPHTPPQLPRSCIRKAAALGQTGAARLRWPCQHQDRVRLLRGPARGRDSHRPCVPAVSPSSSAAEAGARLNTCSYYAAHALLRENQWMFQPLLMGTSSTGDGRRHFSAREVSSLTSRLRGPWGPAPSLAQECCGSASLPPAPAPETSERLVLTGAAGEGRAARAGRSRPQGLPRIFRLAGSGMVRRHSAGAQKRPGDPLSPARVFHFLQSYVHVISVILL